MRIRVSSAQSVKVPLSLLAIVRVTLKRRPDSKRKFSADDVCATVMVIDIGDRHRFELGTLASAMKLESRRGRMTRAEGGSK